MDALAKKPPATRVTAFLSLQVEAEKAELPTKWHTIPVPDIRDSNFTYQLASLTGILFDAIHGDPYLRYRVVNGQPNTPASLIPDFTPAPRPTTIAAGPGGNSTGTRRTQVSVSPEDAAAPTQKRVRTRRTETMAAQMARYNELADYAISINVPGAKRLGGPKGDKTFATYASGETAIEKLTKKIHEHEAAHGAGNGAAA